MILFGSDFISYLQQHGLTMLVVGFAVLMWIISIIEGNNLRAIPTLENKVNNVYLILLGLYLLITTSMLVYVLVAGNGNISSTIFKTFQIAIVTIIVLTIIASVVRNHLNSIKETHKVLRFAYWIVFLIWTFLLIINLYYLQYSQGG